VKLKAYLGVAVFFVTALPSQAEITGEPLRSPPARHFVCDKGYTLKQCDEELVVLKKALAKYPIPELGEWTWVLVRCGVEVWRGGLGGAYRLPTLSSVGASLTPPCFRFHTPLIEPDVRICRIRLSEKTHAIAVAIACDAVCNFWKQLGSCQAHRQSPFPSSLRVSAFN
jgi:hypothetical protein